MKLEDYKTIPYRLALASRKFPPSEAATHPADTTEIVDA
jgi:hypothetical protein